MAQDLGIVELKVFTAVLCFTEMWDRFDDEVSLAQLGGAAGIGGTAKSQATRAGRAVRRLAELGIITYEPATGRGAVGRIGIQRVILGPRNADRICPTFPADELHDDVAGDEKVGSIRTESGTDSNRKWDTRVSPTRRDPEVLPVNPVGRGRASDADPVRVSDSDRAGVEEAQEPPPTPPLAAAEELLTAVAQAAPASARHELLADEGQAGGRATLRALLVRLEDLVGFADAVTSLTVEWPADRRSPMAHAIHRARQRLGDTPAQLPAAPLASARPATLENGAIPPQPPLWEPPADASRSPPAPDWRPPAFRKPTPPRSDP